MTEEMRPTPIEDPEEREAYQARLRHERGQNPWEHFGMSFAEENKLWRAKMAHDSAMESALDTLRLRAAVARAGSRVGYGLLLVLVSLTVLVAALCSSPSVQHVIDDPDHYSRRD